MLTNATDRTPSTLLGVFVLSSSACWAPASVPQPDPEPVVTVPATSETDEAPRRVERRLALGWRYSCLLDEQGGLGCWGDADELENMAAGLAGVEPPLRALESRFGSEGCVVSGEGRVQCWELVSEPKSWLVEELDDAIDLGGSCALRRNSQIACGLEGGPGRASPEQVEGVLEIEESITTRCVRTDQGWGLCWKDERLMGLGPSKHLPPYDDVVALATGEASIWIARSDGHVERCTLALRDCVRMDALDDIVELDAIQDFACGRTSAGRVHCWIGELDEYDAEQLAAIGYWDPHAPTEVEGVEEAIELAVADEHACARRRDGTVHCWGANEFFQLGEQHGWAHHDTPQRISGLPRIEEIAVGTRHACARDDAGRVWCWGWRGGFVDPSARLTYFDRPQQLTSEIDTAAVRVLAGNDFSGSIHADGEATYVGAGLSSFEFDDGSTALPELDRDSVVDFDDWGGGCLAHKRGVVCFGQAAYHAMVYVPSLHVDATYTEMAWSIDSPISGRVIDIGASKDHGCALVHDGRVYCWGFNYAAQLGREKPRERDPAHGDRSLLVAGLPPLVSLDAGDVHTCGIDHEGGAWCWGSHEHGQLGAPPDKPGVPVAVPGLPPLTSIGTGDLHSCALDNSGRVWCWGADDGGPRVIEGLPAIRQLDTATATTCALDHAGDVWCWGRNKHRQASTASPPFSLAAVEVSPDRIIEMIPR